MDELLGRWDLMVGTGEETYPSWLEVGNGSGRFVGRFGSARPVRNVTRNHQWISFSLPRQYEPRESDLVFEGELVEGRLVGATTYDNGTETTWVGYPAPDLPWRDVTWGEPKGLVGHSLENWQPRSTDLANNWSIEDGMLVNSAVGTDLVTTGTYGDFKLIAEYRYPKGSNSGIYLRGRYEFQILDDHDGGKPSVGSSGAIYGFIVPTAHAVNAPDEWNVAEITLVGRYVTVVLNGTTIVDREEIPGITGGALDSAEGEPGPLFVQGDHGPVTFRRLTLYPAAE